MDSERQPSNQDGAQLEDQRKTKEGPEHDRPQMTQRGANRGNNNIKK